MTPQQQLAELVELEANGIRDAVKAICFIRDHGPAIAELIQECTRRPKYNDKDGRYEVSGVDLQFRSLLEAERFVLERIRMAARTITEPK